MLIRAKEGYFYAVCRSRKATRSTAEKLLAAGVEDVARKRAEEAARIRQQQEAERVLRQAQERAERARVRTRSRDDGESGFSR